MNAMSAICEATGADIQEISHSVGTDSRVGPKFLNASVGFGGSCFQKDILNLVYICETLNLPEVAEYWMNIIKINEFQKRRFVHLVVSTLFNTVSGKKISVLGFAFKKDTGDTRETPAIGVCSGLMDDGAVLSVYDPQVSGHDLYMALTAGSRTEWWHPLARQMRDAETDTVKSKVAIAKDAYEACKDSHAVCVLTEWDEFKALDWQRIYDGMAKPAAVFDGRLVLDHDQLRSIGFVVYGIGKPLDPYIAQAIGATH
ncbi:unnamed protein product [Pedinophyceae sp. YPF-701]|nr:unnamed protein product [Pedinophyceae sp. YPF-701]